MDAELGDADDRTGTAGTGLWWEADPQLGERFKR